MTKPNILMVLTSYPTVGSTGTSAGYWFEELAAPYFVFKEAGLDVTLASIKGGAAPRDPLSETPDWTTDATRRFDADAEAMAAVKNTVAIADVVAAKYDAIFLVGGIAAMWDFPGNAALTAVVEDLFVQGKVISSVCHGAAGLVDSKAADGSFIVKDRKLVCWTDAEEALIKTTDIVPFLLESRLVKNGARFEAGPNLGPVVRFDGRFITGQNPASSHNTALGVAAAIHARAEMAA